MTTQTPISVILSTMDDTTFEKLVFEGVDAIPEPFRSKIENVAFFIMDKPTPEQRKQFHLDRHHTLLGLYQGVPQTVRGVHYHLALPDKITIFKEPILALSDDPETIRRIVADTVWHEVGHHFGLNEAEVRHKEAERDKKRETGGE